LSATIIGIFLILGFSAYAATEENFMTDYTIVYDIDDTGVTTVSHKIVITNLKDDLIATNYSLDLKQLDVFDVSASDDKGKLEIFQKKAAGTANLSVSLRTFAVGTGKQNSVTILYKSKQIATKVGEVWNISIPRSQPTSETTKTNVTLSVPASFGQKIFISPIPATESKAGEKISYGFANEQIKNTNITAAFGKYQILNFRLKYQIENDNRYSSNTEIALPADVPGVQLVEYESLNPRPLKQYTDRDGNLMAVYKLKAKQKMDIELVGSAKITGKQIDPTKGGGFKDIPASVRNVYTRPLKYWEANSDDVTKVVASVINNNSTVTENAQNIYQYLVNNYSYEFNIAKKDYVDRKGAAAALFNKSEWGCMEFTDSFIAIARAAGIPAREINGYALTSIDAQRPLSVTFKSGDLLHAWPEFYDPKFGWVQVDPTWGDTSNTDYFTKLDTNHLVFVTKGIKSDYPLPAGAYRTASTEKLVDVSFSQTDNTPGFIMELETKKLTNLNIFQLLLGHSRFRIKNAGNVIVYDKNNAPILPGASKTIYISKKQNAVTFYNSFREEKIVSLNL